MSLAPRPTSTARSKEALELRKIQTDILFVKLSFFAQIFNTLCIATVGIIVLYFFQRPQIDQMEIARLAAEKHQAATLVSNALTMENERDRQMMLDALVELYPQHQFIVAVSRSNLTLAELPKNVPSVVQPGSKESSSAPSAERSEYCRQVDAMIDLVAREDAELAKRADEELRGRSGKLAGAGPAYNAIIAQRTKIDRRIATLRTQSGCFKG